MLCSRHVALWVLPTNLPLQAHVWSSGALRIQDAIDSPAPTAHVQLRLGVDAANPDMPIAQLMLITGDSERLLEPTWQRGEQHKLCVNMLQSPMLSY
jgi:hypothetical protein